MIREVAMAYHQLDLPPGAGLEEVRQAYKRLSRLFHPELNPQANGYLIFLINAAHMKIMDYLMSDGNQAYEGRSANPPQVRPYAMREFDTNANPFQGFGKRKEDRF